VPVSASWATGVAVDRLPRERRSNSARFRTKLH
jgi:hypothetical protein